MSGAPPGHRHWADAASYDYHRTYLVNFLKRPLGMLVEDRGGVCTVVELQRDDDGRIGQAAAHGVMVDDAIVSLQGIDTRHLDFPKLTEHIRQAKMPFQIGFVRHPNNMRTATPPYLMAQRYNNMSPLHNHHALPLMGVPPAHDWAAKPPQYNSSMGHGGLPSPAPLVRPRPVMAQPHQAKASKPSSLPRPVPAYIPSLPKQHGSGSGSSRPKAAQQMPSTTGARAAVKRAMPPTEEESIAGYLRQHKHRKPSGPSTSVPTLQSRQESREKEAAAPVDAMLEELGTAAIQAFLAQPQTGPEDEEDEEGEGGGGGLRVAGKVEEDDMLNEAALGRIKGHFMQVREALLRSRQASHDLYEYSRALLCRNEVMGVVEGRVMELLQHRALDVRDKVQELRAGEGGATGGAAKAAGTLSTELGVRWNEVNEQRRAQLTHQRRVLDKASAELQSLVTDAIPKACRAVECSLQGRMEHLQRLLSGLAELLAPEDAGASGRRAEGRSEASTSAVPSTPRPHLLDYHHHDRPDTPNTVTTTHGPYEHKKPKIGTDCQVTHSGLPAQWAPDPSLTVLTTHLPFPKEGEETCRWKPPPDTPHMPSQAEIDELVSNFRPELQEVVLWELYRRGWDVGSTLEGVKAMLMKGTLRKESPTEPLSKTEAALFEKAMAESWKNFGKAVEMLKGSKDHRSVVVHYYNTFKRSEAYKRLKPKSASGGSLYR